MTTDLEYSKLGLFTAFYANTPQGVEAWNELAKVTDGTGKVLTVQLKQCLAAMRRAGLTVRKAKKSKLSLDEILASLDGGA